MVAIYAVKFLMGDSSDKSEAVGNIKRTLIMGGGIFFLIWLAGEIISRFRLFRRYFFMNWELILDFLKGKLMIILMLQIGF
jgi:hypothetical protein